MKKTTFNQLKQLLLKSDVSLFEALGKHNGKSKMFINKQINKAKKQYDQIHNLDGLIDGYMDSGLKDVEAFECILRHLVEFE